MVKLFKIFGKNVDDLARDVLAAGLDDVELVASSLRAAPLAGAVAKGTIETT